MIFKFVINVSQCLVCGRLRVRILSSTLCAGGRKFESQWLANLTQRCKRLATTSISLHCTQLAVLSWCYDVEMGTANSLHASV